MTHKPPTDEELADWHGWTRELRIAVEEIWRLQGQVRRLRKENDELTAALQEKMAQKPMDTQEMVRRSKLIND